MAPLLSPSAGLGNGNSTSNSASGHTATVTSIQMFNNTGRRITDFSIASGSGTFYDTNAVHFAVTVTESQKDDGFISVIRLLTGPPAVNAATMRSAEVVLLG
ncbi:MAG: hypothetical protein EOO39_36700 [Cytophagaceae bacterium]|nr:MAG: hypothetical protein EOO39_36700 [Cytophagaceae bacterium]